MSTNPLELFKLPYLARKLVFQFMRNSVLPLTKCSKRSEALVKASRIHLPCLKIISSIVHTSLILTSDDSKTYTFTITDQVEKFKGLVRPFKLGLDSFPAYSGAYGICLYLDQQQYRNRIMFFHAFTEWLLNVFVVDAFVFKGHCPNSKVLLHECLKTYNINFREIRFVPCPIKPEPLKMNSALLKNILNCTKLEHLELKCTIPKRFKYQQQLSASKRFAIFDARWMTMNNLKSVISDTILVDNLMFNENEIHALLKDIQNGRIDVRIIMLRSKMDWNLDEILGDIPHRGFDGRYSIPWPAKNSEFYIEFRSPLHQLGLYGYIYISGGAR